MVMYNIYTHLQAFNQTCLNKLQMTFIYLRLSRRGITFRSCTVHNHLKWSRQDKDEYINGINGERWMTNY